MKHLRPVTVARADAFTDLYNAIWRAWRDFRYAKKNDMGL